MDALRSFVGVFEGCEELLVGPGEDDCAVMELGDDLLVQSSDMFLDGVHFPEEATPRQVGWHAAAASVADVASMGARPLGLTLSIAVPAERDLGLLGGVAKGANEAMRRAGGCVSGGDLSRGELCVDCGVVGTVSGDGPILRGGAVEGDAVCVTGTLGGAAAGEAVLVEGLDIPSRRDAVGRLLEPPLRVDEGLRLAGSATAATDLSDGLFRGMEVISERSGVGLTVDPERVPLHPSAVEAVEAGRDVEGLVDGGGDYELLFTAPPGEAERLGFPVIGWVGGDDVRLGGSRDLGGYDAFR